MHEHNIVIEDIAPKDSSCEICSKPAKWQMYCEDCKEIIRFYCDDHAYLSQSKPNVKKQVKKAYIRQEPPKMEKQIKKAQNKWQEYLKHL